MTIGIAVFREAYAHYWSISTAIACCGHEVTMWSNDPELIGFWDLVPLLEHVVLSGSLLADWCSYLGLFGG